MCRHLEISVVVHATESLDKVVDALRGFFGEIPIVVEVLEGHHGNSIYLLTSYIENCNEIYQKILGAFGGFIPASRSGDIHYLRLDKQAFVRGVLKAAELQDDVIRLRYRLKNVD